MPETTTFGYTQKRQKCEHNREKGVGTVGTRKRECNNCKCIIHETFHNTLLSFIFFFFNNKICSNNTLTRPLDQDFTYTNNVSWLYI